MNAPWSLSGILVLSKPPGQHQPPAQHQPPCGRVHKTKKPKSRARSISIPPIVSGKLFFVFLVPYRNFCPSQLVPFGFLVPSQSFGWLSSVSLNLQWFSKPATGNRPDLKRPSKTIRFVGTKWSVSGNGRFVPTKRPLVYRRKEAFRYQKRGRFVETKHAFSKTGCFG